MNEDKHIIWSNYDLDYEDWRGDLEAEYPELSEDERISLMYEINGHYLDDERMNLNVQLLHEHAESDPYEEYREMAQRLIQHFMAHGRSFTDGYQKECVNLRMYPNEAADTIWLLLLSLSGHYSADKNYHADLQPYRKNNE